MPKSIPIQFREGKKINKVLELLKPKDRFLNWISEKLKKLLYLIKIIDIKLKK